MRSLSAYFLEVHHKMRYLYVYAKTTCHEKVFKEPSRCMETSPTYIHWCQNWLVGWVVLGAKGEHHWPELFFQDSQITRLRCLLKSPCDVRDECIPSSNHMIEMYRHTPGQHKRLTRIQTRLDPVPYLPIRTCGLGVLETEKSCPGIFLSRNFVIIAASIDIIIQILNIRNVLSPGACN